LGGVCGDRRGVRRLAGAVRLLARRGLQRRRDRGDRPDDQADRSPKRDDQPALPQPGDRRLVGLPGMKALNRNFLWQDAAAAIRGAIVAGELKADERTSEAQLAEQLGVSRAPIRDAVHVLTYEGLLEQRNGATHVVGYSDDDIRRLYRLRACLAGFAIRQIL